MITDEQARDIALFFLFSLMDQKVALEAAHRAIAQVKALPPDATRVDITRIMKRGFDTHRKMLARNQPTEMSDTALIFAKGADLASWEKFHRASSDAEITAIVLTKILGYSEDDAAKAFQVSLGTMKYRVAKGVRQLGAALPKDGARGTT